MQPGDLVTLTVEKPVAGGRMLAREGGLVVLVWAAIPGEQVRARIDRVTAHTAYATTEDVLVPSSDRRATAGDWRCGGNTYAHVAYDHQRHLKALVVRDAFARLARLTLDRDPNVEPSPERGYRMRARFHVHERRIGFFREGTREVCDPAPTGQLLDASLEVVRRLETVAASGAMDLHTVDLSENVAATARAVHLDLRAGSAISDRSRFDSFGAGAAVSLSIDGGQTTSLVGDPYIEEEMETAAGRIRLRRHVRAFFQGNRYMLRTLVDRVVAQAAADDAVLDLYAGGGLFSVPLALRGASKVIAVEGDSVAGEDLRWNGRLYGRTLKTSRRGVEAYLRDRPRFDGTIIVDPPRTGLSPEASARIGATGARRIVYVSCDVATLARDVSTLRRVGYSIAHVEAFDLFPNTAHVETLAVLTRD